MPTIPKAVSDLFFPPQREVEDSAIKDPLDCRDPEQLRIYAENARRLALATVDPATVESLNAEAQDLEDLARNLESTSKDESATDVVTNDDVEVCAEANVLQYSEFNPVSVG